MKTRRRFIGELIAFVTSIQGASFLRARRAAGAAPAGKKRRHLINLCGFGGWDSSLFHNGIPLAPFLAAAAKNPSQVLVQNDITAPLPAFAGFNRGLPGAYCISNRCADSNGFSYSAPNGLSHFFSGYFKAAIEAAAPIGGSIAAPSFVSSKLAVWKGIQKQGEHGVGNFSVNQGTSAAYAKSYSSLVAEGIAIADYTRPLHHVAIAATSADLSISTNMTLGYETPTYIPDIATFTGLTNGQTPLVNYAPASTAQPVHLMQTDIESAVLALSQQMLPQLKLPSSATALNGYTSNYTSFNMLASSGYATCGEFLGLQVLYALAALQGLVACSSVQPTVGGQNGDVSLASQLTASAGTAYLAMLSYFQSVYKSIQADLTLLIQKPASATPAALKQADTNIITALSKPNTSSIYGSTVMDAINRGAGYIGAPTFAFALGDFLIRNDLTAVISLPVPCYDDHYQWSMHGLFTLSQAFACLSQLVANLSAVQVSGGTLFDSTLIVMQTEMDRWPFLEGAQGGTNHGPTASVLMLGYGVRKGAVVGQIALDPAADYSMYPVNSANPAQPTCFTGLPIDPNSGAGSPTGTLFSVYSILPTVCQIFGVTVPPNQITGANPCPAICA
jgi:hypothetical protein